MKFYLFTALFFLTGFIHAQDASDPCNKVIRGYVLDAETKEALPLAGIWVNGLEKGTTSDEKGYFEISGACQRLYDVDIHYMGYEEFSIKINASENKTHQFYLLPDSKQLSEISVEAAKEYRETMQAVQSIKGKALDMSRGKSLGETLSMISGVSTLNTGATISKPVIHGLHSNRVLMLNNGVRMEGQQWGSDHGPEIDPFLATELTVVKGASSVRYGSDAIAGVILVAPSALPDKIGQDGEINLVGASNGGMGTVSGIFQGKTKALGGLGYRVQGTGKRAGNIRTPDYFMNNTGMRELNFSTAIGWQKKKYDLEAFYSRFSSDIGIFRGAHIGNLTDLRLAMQRGIPYENAIDGGLSYRIERPRQEIVHDLLKLKAQYRLQGVGELSAVYAQQTNSRQEYDTRRGYTTDPGRLDPELDFSLYTTTAVLEFSHVPIGRLQGKAGISGMHQANVFRGRRLIPNFRSYSGGMFLIEKLILDQWEFETGLRYDYKWMRTFERERDGAISSETLIFDNYTASASAAFLPNSKWKIGAHIGKAWRAPNISELFSFGVHHGAASFEIGDVSLQSEVAYNAQVNARYLNKNFQAELTLYNNYIQNFIYLKPVFPEILTVRGAFPTFQYTQVDAVFRGMDGDIFWRLHPKTSLISKFSIVRAWNLIAEDFLVFIPPDRTEHSLRFDLPAWKSLTDNFIQLGALLVAEQKRVPPESDYTDPPAAYQLINLAIGSDIRLGEQKISVGMEVNNALNTRYRDYLNRFRYYAEEMGRNVMIRVKIPF